MLTKRSITRVMLEVGLVTTLACGSEARAQMRVGPWHDGWRAISLCTEGHCACGIETTMTAGGNVAIISGERGGADLVATDPSWSLSDGDRYHVGIGVGDRVYPLSARVSGAHQLVVQGMSKSLLEDFYKEDQAVVDLGVATWTLDLAGTPEAFGDMLNCVEVVAEN